MCQQCGAEIGSDLRHTNAQRLWWCHAQCNRYRLLPVCRKKPPFPLQGIVTVQQIDNCFQSVGINRRSYCTDWRRSAAPESDAAAAALDAAAVSSTVRCASARASFTLPAASILSRCARFVSSRRAACFHDSRSLFRMML
jgi:hypothetical protein